MAQALKPKTSSTRRRRNILAGYLFIAPAGLGLLIFIFIPTIFAFVMSFFDWSMTKESIFVGLKNYQTAFNDALFYNAIKVTLQYIVYHIPASLILAFFMALAIRQGIRGANFFRAAFVLPWITTPIIIAYIWNLLLDGTFGVINYLTKCVGIDLAPMFSTMWWPMVSIALVNMWIFCGYHMMIFTAGLGNIPVTLYEAAKIDGANRVQRLTRITVPLMRPTIMFACITSLIGSFQVFDLAYGMYNGGPGDATRTYYFLLYTNAFKYFKMGYASALAVILFVILVIATFVQYRFFSKNMTTDFSM